MKNLVACIIALAFLLGGCKRDEKMVPPEGQSESYFVSFKSGLEWKRYESGNVIACATNLGFCTVVPSGDDRYFRFLFINKERPIQLDNTAWLQEDTLLFNDDLPVCGFILG